MALCSIHFGSIAITEISGPSGIQELAASIFPCETSSKLSLYLPGVPLWQLPGFPIAALLSSWNCSSEMRRTFWGKWKANFDKVNEGSFQLGSLPSSGMNVQFSCFEWNTPLFVTKMQHLLKLEAPGRIREASILPKEKWFYAETV